MIPNACESRNSDRPTRRWAVAKVTITYGLEALRAEGGVVSLLSEDGATLTNVRVAAWLRYPAETPAPIGEALMRTLGDLCAQALERARLYEAEHAAHEEATTERDRVRQILNTLPVGVVLVDAAGRVTMANGASRDLLGTDVLEQAAVAPDDAYTSYGVRRPEGMPYPTAETAIERALRHGEVVHGDQQIVCHAQTGRDVAVLINSAPLRDAAREILGAVMAFQDISALRDLERAREEFLSSAAHDLKTPLTSIRGYAQLARCRAARLDSREAETAAVLSGLSRAMEGADVMLGLINELVDVARMRMTGGLALHRTPTDLYRPAPPHDRGAARNVTAAPGTGKG